MCWDEAQWSVADCLTTVCKVLGSIPTTAPRKRNKDTEEIKALNNGTDNRHRALDSTACCRWLLRDTSLGFSSDWQTGHSSCCCDKMPEKINIKEDRLKWVCSLEAQDHIGKVVVTLCPQ